MVHIGSVRMGVPQPFMAMPMRVGFSGWIVGAVGVLMVIVMAMNVSMFERLMHMFVLVIFCQMQPDARRH